MVTIQLMLSWDWEGGECFHGWCCQKVERWVVVWLVLPKSVVYGGNVADVAMKWGSWQWHRRCCHNARQLSVAWLILLP